MENQQEIRHVVIMASPNSTLLNIAGPLDVFVKATERIDSLMDKVGFKYKTHVVSVEKGKQVDTTSGLPILTEGCYKNIDYPIDTLILSGRSCSPDYQIKSEFIDWVKEQSTVVRRICSVCSATFILAEAGILNGRKATTHWMKSDQLSQMYPQIDVQIAQIFVKDGNVYTSGGITSGIDLALALIEEDLGKLFSLHIARWMVVFLKRPGNQAQFSTLLDCQNIENLSIRKVCEWILTHLNEDLTVERLAEYSAMSPRNFARVFVRELHVTPAKYIDKLRVENACQYLIETQLSLDEIASQCGLKSAENLRRQFIKLLDITPTQYRRSFMSSFG